MDAIRTLKDEHRVVEQVLNCLERIALKAREHRRLDASLAGDALRILATYADQCHHGKEEEALFPFLEQEKGYSPGCGATAALRAEHAQARLHLQAMREILEDAAPLDLRAIDRFVGHAVRYLELLRTGIRKEERCLFEDIEPKLSSRDHWELIEGYERVENRVGFEMREQMLQSARILADRLGVPRVREEAGPGCGCRPGGGSTAHRGTAPRVGSGTSDDPVPVERPCRPAGF